MAANDTADVRSAPEEQRFEVDVVPALVGERTELCASLFCFLSSAE